MKLQNVSLARQMDYIFRGLQDELRYAKSGTVTVHIRDNEIGKFGVKHEPIEMRGEPLPRSEVSMSDDQLKAFRELAVGSLDHKKGWTHGQISYEFVVRKSILCISVQFESNYNLAGLIIKMNPQK
jgi:hypothetical protein